MSEQPKLVPMLDPAEVDALLDLVDGTTLSPEAAAVIEAVRVRLLRSQLRVIEGGAGWDPEALSAYNLHNG